MIGAAFIYGICVAMSEWGNIWAFSILIWIFIPFLLATRVFTTPEFMERRLYRGWQRRRGNSMRMLPIPITNQAGVAPA